MDWLAHNYGLLIVAAGLVATWATMTLKMSQWDKIIPTLATKSDVQQSIDLSLKTLQLDLMKAESAKQSAEMERLRKAASRADDQ